MITKSVTPKFMLKITNQLSGSLLETHEQMSSCVSDHGSL